MPQITAEPGAVRKDVPLLAGDSRRHVRASLFDGIYDVLDVAIGYSGTTDLRRGILTAVYNYDTESFEIRWDIAK